MSGSRDIVRTPPFWLMFAVSTLGGVSNSAATPTIPAYVDTVFGGGPELSGALISISSISSIVAMPLGGVLADRYGYRIVAVVSILASASSFVLLAAVPELWGAVVSRLLFGLGNAAAMALTLTWLVGLSSPAERGKALSIFGLSVWLGLALGPQVATAVLALAEPWTVFLVCATIEIAVCLLFLPLPAPRVGTATSPVSTTARPRRLRAVADVLRAVWVPGVAAAAAWCGEGLVLGFLIVHLTGAGVAATGVFGAASVFGVFAVSVIGARIVLARMPDRIGPLRSAAISLTALCAGLAVIGLATGFAVAAAGAVMMGIGFSPLYPSLTMLATRGLRATDRALGLGMFASFTSVGYASGALVGGAMLAVLSSTWAFLVVAGLQLVALAVLVVFTRDDQPRPRLDPGEPRLPAG